MSDRTTTTQATRSIEVIAVEDTRGTVEEFVEERAVHGLITHGVPDADAM